MKNIVIVIPSLEPDERIIKLVSSIRDYTAGWSVVVVNDGSSEKYQSIFQEVEDKYKCIVIRHQLNQGKGAALKTAMRYILENMNDAKYMVTIDSDGQHTLVDMVQCIEAAKKNPSTLVLGVRAFNEEVPFRSKFGNILTRNILNAITGIKLTDTQTGLRVIPTPFLEKLLTVSGNRFEYETNMILETKKSHWEIYSQPIETIYLEDNASSHFRVIQDSIAIYSTFMKYILSSVASFLLDILVYAILLRMFDKLGLDTILFASTGARIISSVFNYLVNKNIVFERKTKYSMLKYFSLALFQIGLSGILVYYTHVLFLQINTILLKVIIDGLLFFFSYYIQKKYIFRR